MPWWLCQPQPEAEVMVLSLVPIPTIRQDKWVCFTNPSPFILLESNGSSTVSQNPNRDTKVSFTSVWPRRLLL